MKMLIPWKLFPKWKSRMRMEAKTDLKEMVTKALQTVVVVASETEHRVDNFEAPDLTMEAAASGKKKSLLSH